MRAKRIRAAFCPEFFCLAFFCLAGLMDEMAIEAQTDPVGNATGRRQVKFVLRGLRFEIRCFALTDRPR
jgi:hypothetical protein